MEKDPNMKDGLKRHGILSSTGFYIKSSAREVRRRKLYFCLALISTLLVVAATAVSQTILHYAPLIFLQSSESKAGAIDLSVSPIGVGFTEYDGVDTEYVSKSLLLNTSRIYSQVDPIYPGVTAARYSTSCRLRLTQNQDASCRSTSTPPYTNCPYYSTTFVIQNTGRESSIGMGVDLGLPNRIPEGGIVITSKLASYLGLKTGDSLVVQVDVTQILREVVIQYNFKQTVASKRINDNQLYNSIAYLPVYVYQVVSKLDGKFPDDSADDMVLSEYQYFFSQIADHRPTNYANTYSHTNYLQFINFLATEDPQNYANVVSFNIPDRLKVYTNSNFDDVQDKIIYFAGKVTDAIGIYPFQAKLPVYEELANLTLKGGKLPREFVLGSVEGEKKS